MADLYSIAKAVLFRLPPETAHSLVLPNLNWMAHFGLTRLLATPPQEDPIEVMGLRFPNCVGLAAGMDKDGKYVTALGALGFGSIEVGTVTPRGQAGNEKPRSFRLVDDEAIINRMGFNNEGALQVASNLQSARPYRNRGGILGINIGKNKTTPNDQAASDYLKCMDRLYDYADYLAINVSSPNTPGLRDLQAEADLKNLLTAIAEKRKQLTKERGGSPVPIAVKLSPDLVNDSIKTALDVIVETGMDGVICTNTTTSRVEIRGNKFAHEAGGLSGKPLFERSTEVTRIASEHLKGALPIIASGGVMSGKDAIEKMQAGASIVQLYTGFIYKGPALITECVNAIKQWRNLH
ncbi:MAG: quinone-dependent dihydroorotate dehydrogenase [Burkholderiales bacterium]|nr:quinone-dependent dihydroorotate dehydrogenase [Burkholderiales bacterium]